jgi:hypothetical protein
MKKVIDGRVVEFIIVEAYMQILIDEEQSYFQFLNLEAFRLPHKYYRMVSLPFGLHIAPNALQLIVQHCLAKGKPDLNRQVFAYFDDIAQRSGLTTLYIVIIWQNTIFHQRNPIL